MPWYDSPLHSIAWRDVTRRAITLQYATPCGVTLQCNIVARDNALQRGVILYHATWHASTSHHNALHHITRRGVAWRDVTPQGMTVHCLASRRNTMQPNAYYV
eukprot:5784236-Lingulodinium_polyedra.AAC.1